jgi:hypothetical protein
MNLYTWNDTCMMQAVINAPVWIRQKTHIDGVQSDGRQKLRLISLYVEGKSDAWLGNSYSDRKISIVHEPAKKEGETERDPEGRQIT